MEESCEGRECHSDRDFLGSICDYPTSDLTANHYSCTYSICSLALGLFESIVFVDLLTLPHISRVFNRLTSAFRDSKTLPIPKYGWSLFAIEVFKGAPFR